MFMRRTDDKTETVILWTHHECSKQRSGEVNNAGVVWMREEEEDADLVCARWMG